MGFGGRGGSTGVMRLGRRGGSRREVLGLGSRVRSSGGSSVR